jgi:3-methyladenine DNA glycosylase AlkC
VAELLKDKFDAEMVRGVAADLARAWPGFDRRAFERRVLPRLGRLELLARAWAVADALHELLPKRFPEAARVLLDSLGPPLEKTDGVGFDVFRYLPHEFWVSKHGLEHPDLALDLQAELTKRFTAEFSLRAYLERHPEKTLARLREWAVDPNVHVRRLVSEGSRPRLPWAPRLRALQKDPSIGLGLLELLKDDPELYVRRSVANHLNDVSKDHPDLAVRVAAAWMRGADERRRWVIRHALRDLVRKGHPGALRVLGAGAAPKVAVRRLRLPRTVRRGAVLEFSLELASRSRSPQDLLVDFGVRFVKARGATSLKVFKLARATLPPGGALPLRGRVSFRPMTTRVVRPGRHALELRVNGRAIPLGAVDVK